MVKPPPDEVEQLKHSRLYPRLGLVGQVGTRAANPELNAALKKSVADALAPLTELEERVAKQLNQVAPATSNFRRRQSEAEADLGAGRAPISEILSYRA